MHLAWCYANKCSHMAVKTVKPDGLAAPRVRRVCKVPARPVRHQPGRQLSQLLRQVFRRRVVQAAVRRGSPRRARAARTARPHPFWPRPLLRYSRRAVPSLFLYNGSWIIQCITSGHQTGKRPVGLGRKRRMRGYDRPQATMLTVVSPAAVPMRSPPYEAWASPRPRLRATQDVTFRVDQVLRSHRADHEAQERRFTAATRAVAVEAINNAVALILFGHLAKKNPFVRFSIALTREQFDSQLPLIAERLSPAHLQLTATVYMEAFRYKVLIDENVAQSTQLSQQQNQGCVKPEPKLFRGLSDPRAFGVRPRANRRF
jgi:hypothetical protein